MTDFDIWIVSPAELSYSHFMSKLNLWPNFINWLPFLNSTKLIIVSVLYFYNVTLLFFVIFHGNQQNTYLILQGKLFRQLMPKPPTEYH